MSRYIKVEENVIDEIRGEFEKALAKVSMVDGKFTFTKSFGSITEKATLFFTEMAYMKMMALVRDFDKEIAWHGIAKRGESEGKHEYIISDIMVYPQRVTGATVTTDQEEYTKWLMSWDDDVFNNIRMQGHSHVKMGTTPSATDNSFYDAIIQQCPDDTFYVFLIWNKLGEKTIRIYDFAKNLFFDTSDVTVTVLDENMGLSKFLEDAKSKVKDEIPRVSTYSYGGYGGGYSGHYSYGGYGYHNDYDDDFLGPEYYRKDSQKTVYSIQTTTHPTPAKTTEATSVKCVESVKPSEKKSGKNKKKHRRRFL